MTEKTVDLRELRKPFPPELVGKLPRVTCGDCSDRRKECGKHNKVKCGICGAYVSEKHIHIDYVGHADVTSKLLEVDPEWNWEPKAEDERGMPVFDLDREGSPVGMWIKLSVGGVTRLGYGSCPSGQPDAVKVLIGDALRNAAMRFGVALDLWAKGDRADPTAENATASAGQAKRGSQSAGDVFENATPARPGQNGGSGNGQRGQVSRPAQPVPAAAPDAPQDIDPDAQVFADEAHGALTLNELEAIHKRARETGKVGLFIKNPSSGGLGKLAVYLDWRRKAVKETEDALADLVKALGEREIGDIDGWFKSVMNTDIDAATASQIRTAAKTLREKAAA